ncbi:MAG: hypothetical protein ACT4UP_03240 [Gammaproteobacteria bacterium]
MRAIILTLMIFAIAAHAGESPPYGKPGAQPPKNQWIFCRVTIARPGRPLGSNDVIVYTGSTPMKQVNWHDYGIAFGAYVTKQYGLQGHRTGQCFGANSREEGQRSLDYLTTNQNNPSQIQVVKTGWTLP